ncbi:hypothetical protein FA95DRAFT_1568059 [Auriscalpium vulgare]|uniref:Uncharacterized protein n=1 Tax=Auriscalpium vulgare TaxID=40419 RepID=A0ACB8R174_9AGAM|nr:hypothetical protein FA95DRAFT_1568059 [Auriscalpium vulgare]
MFGATNFPSDTLLPHELWLADPPPPYSSIAMPAMGPTGGDGPSQRQSLPTSFEPPRAPITPEFPAINVPQLRPAVQSRTVWPHAPVLSWRQATKYCPGGSFEYRGFRFIRLLVGEDVEVMHEHGHPQKSRMLQDVDEHYDDTLVLVRKADNIWNPLGWVWESLLQSTGGEYEEAAGALSAQPFTGYRTPLERNLMDAGHHDYDPWLHDDPSYGQSHGSFSATSASDIMPSGASTLSATSYLDSPVSMKTMISISSYKTRMNQSIQPPGTVFLR